MLPLGLTFQRPLTCLNAAPDPWPPFWGLVLFLALRLSLNLRGSCCRAATWPVSDLPVAKPEGIQKDSEEDTWLLEMKDAGKGGWQHLNKGEELPPGRRL